MNQKNQNPPNQSRSASFTDSLLVGLIKYRNLLIALVVIVALAGGGAFFWMQKSAADEEAAALALSKAVNLMQVGELDKAVDGDSTATGLKGIVSKFGNTPSGNMARLYLGTIHYTRQRPDDAISAFRAFTHKNKDLQAAALAGEAASLTQKKDFTGAAAAYEKASSTAVNEALKALYLKSAADNHAAAGDKAKAEKQSGDVTEQWPGTSYAAEAQRTLWRLSGATR